MKIIIFKWFCGWCISLLAIWLITAIFTNPIGEGYWSKELQRYTYPEGTEVLWREEGWGSTKYGKLGINDNENILSSTNPKIVLWGDSHIQNRHVDDAEKAQTVFNSLSSAEKLEYRAINMGMFGQNIAHYCVQIPIYEKLVPNIRHHFIIVSGMKDLLPPKIYAHAQNEPVVVWRNNELSITSGIAGTRSAENLRMLISSYRLQILKHVKNVILGSEKLNTEPIWSRLNFSGKDTVDINDIKYDSEKMSLSEIKKISKGDYWDFLIKELKSTTQLPVTIIYSPTFPLFYKNRVVFNSNEEKDLAAFREKCEQLGVNCLDLNKECIDLYLEKKQFHRGFFNTVPSTGHVNANFNKILAQKILNYLPKKVFDGIPPN